MVLCEKPLGRSAAESAEMVAAVERAGVASMVWYNYRRVPAVMLAKRLVDDGRLGRVFHYRANFLQDWTISRGPAAGRRCAVAARRGSVAGSAASPGTCSRTASTPRCGLNGGVREVSGHDRDLHRRARAPAHRPAREGDHRRRVRVPGALRQRSSLGLFEATRYARGHKALYTLEINGERMSLRWDLHDLHRLEVFDHADEGLTRGWRSVHVTDGGHPVHGALVGAGALQIGYEHELRAPGGRLPRGPGLRRARRRRASAEAHATDLVTDAVLASAASGRWARPFEEPLIRACPQLQRRAASTRDFGRSCAPWTASPSTSPTASSSACSVRPRRARPRPCARSRGSRR